jgi:cytochrome c-type biogenesis protein CcmE
LEVFSIPLAWSFRRFVVQLPAHLDNVYWVARVEMTGVQEVAPSPAAKRLNRRQIRFIVGGAIIALTVAYMVFNAASGSAAFYVTVQEALTQAPVSQRDVRVSGLIVGDSIVWEPRDLRLEFQIADDSGTLPVVYQGARPDMFRDGAEVVVEGRMSAQGVFEARTMLLKCPSKYEEAD